MMGIEFEVRTKETVEDYPEHLQNEQIVLYLASKKLLLSKMRFRKMNYSSAQIPLLYIRTKC